MSKRMILNGRKCKLFNVGKFNLITRMSGLIIDSVDHDIYYLDLTIDKHSTFDNHINGIKNKIRQSISKIKRAKHILNPKVGFLIYYSHIHSSLVYLVPVWGTTNNTDLQRVQNKALELVFNFKTETPTHNRFFFWLNFMRIQKLISRMQ